ncbi:MAG: 4-hydroxybenzoate octaprenyltransferase [Planctomycetes bacterium]|nr:4-hydroxybenzoate octaprenyltransferase [Planctomycetota bacterium]
MSSASTNPIAPMEHPARLGGRLAVAAGDIKLSHSIFAMPFALLATFLARPVDMAWSKFALVLALVVACMFVARTWAMIINRLADRRLDAANPRTARRAFASGRLSSAFGAGLALALVAAFAALTSLFWLLLANPWPLFLSLPVLAWIGLYSITKRFTWACHLFLGTSLAASPLAAAIAINPAVLGLSDGPELPGVRACLLLLAGMVTLWVAGFDIIYALQDVDVDRRDGLYSIPSRLGVPTALWLSRAFHLGALALLVFAWRADPRLGALFGFGVACVGLLLVIEHAILARRGKAGLEAAFFTVNGVVSLLVGSLGICDLVLV